MLSDIKRKSVFVNDCHLVCLVVGDPSHPAIIMIHGWIQHPDVWLNTMHAFKKTHYCIAIGLIGMGESDIPSDRDYSIERHGRDTLAIANALGIERFILIGQSRGVQVALCIASQLAPERVLKLVDISGVVTGRVLWHMHWVIRLGVWLGYHLPFMYNFFRHILQIRKIAQLLYIPYIDNFKTVPRDFSIRELLRPLSPEKRVANYLSMKTMISTNLLSSLELVTAPTLIIFGRNDGVVPISEGYIAAEHIRSARLEILEKCRHYPMYEQPEKYIAILKEFLL